LPDQGRSAFKRLPRPFARKPKPDGVSTATVDTTALDQAVEPETSDARTDA
jgi:hypothetical protein